MAQAIQAMKSLKRDDRVLTPDGRTPTMTEYLCGGLRTACDSCPALGAILNPDSALVPIPGSALALVHGLWVPNRIAHAMVAVGFGREVLACLRRQTAIRKSATAGYDRPSAQEHCDSMVAIAPMRWPARIILVDDVITKGATIMGAAKRLRLAGCDSELLAFSMLRTLRNESDFKKWFDPVTGRITLSAYGSSSTHVY